MIEGEAKRPLLSNDEVQVNIGGGGAYDIYAPGTGRRDSINSVSGVDVPLKPVRFDPKSVNSISMLEASDNEFDYTFGSLDTSPNGLSHEAAASRLKHFGLNKLAISNGLKWYHHLWNALVHPFNLLLLALAIVSGVTGDPASAIVMSTLVLVSVVLRFWQELKSAIAADSLKSQITKRVTVVRGGKKRPIAFEEVVPGDVVELSAGSLVPADMRLFAMEHLLVNESALTGESMPAEKTNAVWMYTPKIGAPPLHESKAGPSRPSTDNVSDDSEIHRLNLAFMGTSVETGWALGVVLRTGNETFMGRHANILIKERPPTAFAKGVQRVSFLLIGFMFAMVPIVIVLNGSLNGDWVEASLFGVAVAVGLTPEMLPMIVNTNLSRGAHMLAKQKIIVKRLEAIQNFGAMTVLCTDKTGTLTEDNVILGDILDIYGGKSTRTLQYAFYISHYQTGFKNPLDQAIINFVQEKQILDPQLLRMVKKSAELPFDFKRRRMSVLVSTTQRAPSRFHIDESLHVEMLDVPLLCCKGAVEEMLARCTHFTNRSGESQLFDATTLKQVQSLVAKFNSQGLRLLAVATKEWHEERQELKLDDESNLTLAGFLAFHDPPKRDANQGVQDVLAKGCQVKVLTGDNILVARKVCADLGLDVEYTITGEELFEMPEDDVEQWQTMAKRTTIFAKLSPGQKARIVQVLKDMGETVGFLGDGINDALALREADVGVSVDTATELAKEAADIILTEKSLCVLSNAITEGRRTHGNTLKYIKMAASSNFGNVFSMLVASSWLPFLPMLPIHILAQNLLYDISQISIPWDNMDPEYLAKPHGWSAKGIAYFMLFVGPVSSIFDITTFAFMWWYYDCNDGDDEYKVHLFQSCWFVIGLLTQTLIVHMIRTEKLPFIQSWPARSVIVLTLIIMAIGIALPNIPVLARAFSFEAPPTFFYAYLAAAIFCYCFLTQIIKQVYIRRFREWL